MRVRVRIVLCAGLLSSAVCAEPTPLPFKPPFAVKNAVIVDQDGRKVKLWGVNYLAPFNHNFVNIRQAGVDLKTAIDTDIAHFKLMNIDFIAGFGAVERKKTPKVCGSQPF